jgi:purine-nucleoside phosphorylase
MIYEYILDGNKKYGTNPIDIVRSSLGCEPEIIQKDVIIAPAWKPELFDNYTNDIKEIYDGIYKIWNLSIKGKIITYILTGIGAPNVLEVVLALGCSPCKNIIFIGSVGGLDKNFKIGDIVIPEYSICGDGACRYLSNKKISENNCFGEKYYPNKDLYETIISKTKNLAKENNIKWHNGKNYSIDTVIAQFAHIDEILDMGCNCIEMETAALFKSAGICKIKAGAVFSVSDNTILKKSLLSGRTEDEINYRIYVRKSVLTKIVLECLQ